MSLLQKMIAHRGLTFMTLIAVLFLIGLGSWQTYRLQWKEALIEDLEAKLSQSSIEVTSGNIAALVPFQPEAAFTKVVVQGEFLHEHEITLAAKYYKGKHGYHILTPLQMPGGDIVLINRGWVTEDHQKPEMRPDSQPEGMQVVRGVLRESEEPAWFMPKNDPAKDIWLHPDLSQIFPYLEKHGLEMTPVYIQAMGEANQHPIPLTPEIEVRNDHLQYAITWYSLAIVLIIMYGIYIYREPAKKKPR